MLNVTINNLGDIAVLQCAGRMTFGNVIALQNAALTRVHVRMLVLDLARVSTIDAAGLGTLVAVRSSMRATGTELKLMNLMRGVERVLELTSLRSLFEICSVKDMLELLCGATRNHQLSAAIMELPPPHGLRDKSYLTGPARFVSIAMSS
jgi:anti-anti-sigma factor